MRQEKSIVGIKRPFSTKTVVDSIDADIKDRVGLRLWQNMLGGPKGRLFPRKIQRIRIKLTYC